MADCSVLTNRERPTMNDYAVLSYGLKSSIPPPSPINIIPIPPAECRAGLLVTYNSLLLCLGTTGLLRVKRPKSIEATLYGYLFGSNSFSTKLIVYLSRRKCRFSPLARNGRNPVICPLAIQVHRSTMLFFLVFRYAWGSSKIEI